MSARVKSKMVSLHRVAPFASLLALAACSGVLGIEDLSEGARPGSGGSSGSAGKGSGGDGISAGGDAQPQAGNGGNGHGGSAPIAGSSSVGDAGEGGAAGSGEAGGTGGTGGSTTGGSGGGGNGGPVHGHVIDYWGHALSGVPVEVGGTKVTTDDSGAFTIPNAAAQYDASLIVTFPDNYQGQTYGWVYQGLTRRDPTLQVYAGLKEQSANLDVNLTHADTTLTANRTMTAAYASVDGSQEDTELDLAAYDGKEVDWRGPSTTQATAHALIWTQDKNSLPTAYNAYDTKFVTLNGATTNHSVVTLDMSVKTIQAFNVTGTVAGAGGGMRSNSVFLQFTSNAVITLVQDSAATASFTYLAPSLANSTLVASASEGSGYDGSAFSGSYAVAHQDGLVSGAAAATLTIPKVATQLAVAPAASRTKVDSTTQFSFQPGAGSAGLFVVAIRQPDNNALHTDALFIVTTKTTLTLPKVVNDTFALDPGKPYVWRVETHGPFANMDAGATATGFLDSFSGDFYGLVPSGPRRASGSFAISDYSDEITMAP